MIVNNFSAISIFKSQVKFSSLYFLPKHILCALDYSCITTPIEILRSEDGSSNQPTESKFVRRVAVARPTSESFDRGIHTSPPRILEEGIAKEERAVTAALSLFRRRRKNNERIV